MRASSAAIFVRRGLTSAAFGNYTWNPTGRIRVLNDFGELQRRIVERSEGWQDVRGAVDWNRKVLERPAVGRELKIDVTGMPPDQVANAALEFLDLATTRH